MVSIDLEPAVGLVAVVTLPAAALAGLFVGAQAAAVTAIVGWLLLVPVLGILSEEDIVQLDEDEVTTEAETPIDALRDRYARGDIDEVEFERRLEALLETEDAEMPPTAETAATDESESASPAVEFER